MVADKSASAATTARLGALPGAVARNSAFYFSSLAIPAIAAIVLVPITVRALGPTRFGLLALAWAVGEGIGMFDFGLSRATVRFVADALTQRAARLRQVVAMAVATQATVGVLAGAALLAAAPLVATRVFSIPAEAAGEALAMFQVLALNVPVIMILNALRSTLEGAQRFDLQAAIRIPGSLASLLIPAVAASLGASLPVILWALLGSRLVLAAVALVVVHRGVPGFEWEAPREWSLLAELLRYSGWVAVSTFLSPVLGSLDRFALGAVRGVTALGFYTGAAEAATRFLLLPVTAFAALLPVLSSSGSSGQRERSLQITRAARRQLAAASLPVCLLLAALAPQLLGVWLGPGFAAEAGTALRILAVGVFLTGLAHLPLVLLYGSARPDLPAKLNMGQVVLHVPFTIIAVRLWGINGAALAWALRASLDLLLYEWARIRALGQHAPSDGERRRESALWVLGVLLAAGAVGGAWLMTRLPAAGLALMTLAVAAYVRFSWRLVLTASERAAWASLAIPPAWRGERGFFHPDTDRDWRWFGAEEPYFGVLTHNRFRRSVLNERSLAEFFASGEREVEELADRISRHFGREFVWDRALDFGCGVGRMLLPLSGRCREAVGVDVSPAMLEEARRNCERRGITNTALQSPGAALGNGGGTFDFVHSYIVFQHIPPRRGEELTEQILRVLRPEGIGALHFAYRIELPAAKRAYIWARDRIPGAQRLVNLLKRRHPDTPVMRMYEYSIPRLVRLLHDAGCREVTAWSTVHGAASEAGSPGMATATTYGVMLLFRKRGDTRPTT